MPTDNTIVDVIKQLPSVTLNDAATDNSQTKANQSDINLRGDHNVVTLTPTSTINQKKRKTYNIFLFLILIGFIIAAALAYSAIDKQTNNLAKYVQEQQHKILSESKSYTDANVVSALSEVKDELAKIAYQSQEGSRNIIRIQLIREYDMYLIDGKNTINHRELTALRDLYKYYLSIDGNHDVPPRAFQFEQMLAKKQITMIE